MAEQVRSTLKGAGFEVVGQYAPYDGARVIVVTGDELKRSAAETELGGFAAAQRVAVTRVGDTIQVTYTNPTYMAHAYRLEDDLAGVSEKLRGAKRGVQRR